jgi:hypothetical protein
MVKGTIPVSEDFLQNFRYVNRLDLCTDNNLTLKNHHSTQTKKCSINIFPMNAIVKRVSVGQTTGVVNRDSAVL